MKTAKWSLENLRVNYRVPYVFFGNQVCVSWKSSLRFLEIKFAFQRIKFLFQRIKFTFQRIKIAFQRIKFLFQRIKFTFQRTKIASKRIKFFSTESSFYTKNQVVVISLMISIVHGSEQYDRHFDWNYAI